MNLNSSITEGPSVGPIFKTESITIFLPWVHLLPCLKEIHFRTSENLSRAEIASIIKNYLQEPRVPTIHLKPPQLLDESTTLLEGEKILSYDSELGVHLIPASQKQSITSEEATINELASQMGEQYGEYMENAFREHFSLEKEYPVELSVENIRSFFKENLLLGEGEILPSPQAVEEEYRRQLVGKPPQEDKDYFSLQMDDYSKEMRGDRDLRTGFAGSSGPLPNQEVQKAPLLSKAYLHVLGEYSRMVLKGDPRFGPVALHAGTAEAGISYDWARFEIRINGKTFKPSGSDLNEKTFELEIATLLGKECPAPLLEELKMLMSTNGRTAGFASGDNIKTGMNLGTKENTLHPRPEVVDISYEEGKFKLNYRTGGVYLKGMDIPTGEEFPLGVHLTFTKKDDNFFNDNRPEDIEGTPEVYGAYTYSLEPDLGESKSFRDRFEIERSLTAFGNFQHP